MFKAILKGDTSPTLEDRMDDGSSIRDTDSQCPGCLYYDKLSGTTCAAFPEGIPIIIITGQYDHTFEYNIGGLNDGGITYVPL